MSIAFSFIVQHNFIPRHVITDIEELKWPMNMQEMPFGLLMKIKQTIAKTSRTYADEMCASMFHSYLYARHIDVMQKFKMAHEIETNHFFNQCVKKEFMEKFCGFQRTYRAFCRLAHIYKKKRSEVRTNMDMLMTPICEADKNVICILESSGKYLFSVSDIVNIFNMSLLNLSYFVPNPLPVKNPYTNTAFSLVNMYNMYFFLKDHMYNVPVLFHCFFATNFDTTMFLCKYRDNIQNKALDRYIDTSRYSQLVVGLSDMIYEYSVRHYINIHPAFPQKDLFDIMKPYLRIFYKSKYSTNAQQLDYYKKILKIQLLNFFSYNPMFGSIVKHADSNRDTHIFNKMCIPYNTNNPMTNKSGFKMYRRGDSDDQNIDFSLEHIGIQTRPHLRRANAYVRPRVIEETESDDSDDIEDDEVDPIDALNAMSIS